MDIGVPREYVDDMPDLEPVDIMQNPDYLPIWRRNIVLHGQPEFDDMPELEPVDIPKVSYPKDSANAN